MEDFKLKECINKINNIQKEERINMLWQWCRQGNINLKQFKVLLNYCL